MLELERGFHPSDRPSTNLPTLLKMKFRHKKTDHSKRAIEKWKAKQQIASVDTYAKHNQRAIEGETLIDLLMLATGGPVESKYTTEAVHT